MSSISFATELERFDKKSDCEEIKKLVDRHDKLYEMSRKLEFVFSLSNLITLVGSAFLLGLPAFLFVSADEPLNYAKFGSIFAIGIYQSFIVCYHGEKLKTSSTKVAEKTLTCDWFEINKEQQSEACSATDSAKGSKTSSVNSDELILPLNRFSSSPTHTLVCFGQFIHKLKIACFV